MPKRRAFQRFDRRAIFHVHGAVMTLWMPFFLLRTALIASRLVAV